MNVVELKRLLLSAATLRAESDEGWEVERDGVPMACMFDETHDRVRVLAPVVGLEDVSPEQQAVVLEANFHTTLDARYATARGTMYALYVHRLSTMDATDLVSALEQVASLVHTFGDDYSSGALIYGPDYDALH